MSNFLEQLNQIKTLILSTVKSEKSFAYSTLQHMQEQSSIDESLIHSLVDSIPSLISPIIGDIRDVDANEEIVTLALKCLGFILYHPLLVTSIPNEYVDRVLESLARLIKMTKIKVVCNLGVWCISIQQLEASSLVCHFDSLLMAIVHSIDNPSGSLSTTFEAIQAVMKLSTQISEKMRDTSSIWAPPLYRRLLSSDKRERDMCIRCLLKIKILISPPPLVLSKAISQDLKLRLLPGMKELLKQGKKVQALQAWGWFMCILGSYCLKTRHLVNEMLKVPEQTFSDPDPQVQLATQVAWESLIDALVYIPSGVCGFVTTPQPEIESSKLNLDKLEANRGIVQTGGYSKSLKLIMTPLIGIVTTEADLSVRLSCLNTWCYLLHKLDSFVNDPDVLGTVLEPMFKAVFNIKLLDKNIPVWRFCIDLLEDIIESKRDCVKKRSHDYPIKWFSWTSSLLDFVVRMIHMAFDQAASTSSCLENRKLACDTVLKIFRNFLKGVQVDFTNASSTHETIMLSLNSILRFTRMVCEAAMHEEDDTNEFQVTCLHFLEAVTQELDSSFLGSPLYKISLDIKGTSNLQHASEAATITTRNLGADPTGLEYGEILLLQPLPRSHMKHLSVAGPKRPMFDRKEPPLPATQNASEDWLKMPMGSIDKVSPIVHVTMSYFSVVVQLSSKSLQEASNYFYTILSSYDSLEVLHAVVFVLYAYVKKNSSLPVWITIAKSFRDHIANDMMLLKIQPESTGSLTSSHLFLYPFIVYTLPKPTSMENPTSEEVRELWVSLFCLVNSIHLQEPPQLNSFSENMCSSLNGLLERVDLSEVYSSTNTQEHFIHLCGDVAMCILENVHIEKVTPEAIKFGYTGFSGINNCLKFTARVMKLLWTKKEEASVNRLVSRLFTSLTHFVGCLQWKEYIVSFIKALSDPLLPWLSDTYTKNDPLQLLWIKIIKTLQHSFPAIKFDSSFLNLQSPLLEKTLDHPNSSISEPTFTLWNSTYGVDKTDPLLFSPKLLEVLDKLSRTGKIKTPNLKIANSPNPEFNVNAKLNTCSKRVELKMPPCPKKRKMSELTEHQKEVRRAQQGKVRDSSGHGPGIRTYTSLDFSQGNEDSQESQDIRDPELILDLLRRVS